MKNKVPKQEWKCTVCLEVFTFEHLLNQQRASKHNVQETLQEERDIHMDKVTKAPLIEITRTILKNMGKQMRYECGICILTFSSMEALKKHEKSIHSTVKNIKCILCSKRFRTLKNRRFIWKVRA